MDIRVQRFRRNQQVNVIFEGAGDQPLPFCLKVSQQCVVFQVFLRHASQEFLDDGFVAGLNSDVFGSVFPQWRLAIERGRSVCFFVLFRRLCYYSFGMRSQCRLSGTRLRLFSLGAKHQLSKVADGSDPGIFLIFRRCLEGKSAFLGDQLEDPIARNLGSRAILYIERILGGDFRLIQIAIANFFTLIKYPPEPA